MLCIPHMLINWSNKSTLLAFPSEAPPTPAHEKSVICPTIWTFFHPIDLLIESKLSEQEFIPQRLMILVQIPNVFLPYLPLILLLRSAVYFGTGQFHLFVIAIFLFLPLTAGIYRFIDRSRYERRQAAQKSVLLRACSSEWTYFLFFGRVRYHSEHFLLWFACCWWTEFE